MQCSLMKSTLSSERILVPSQQFDWYPSTLSFDDHCFLSFRQLNAICFRQLYMSTGTFLFISGKMLTNDFVCYLVEVEQRHKGRALHNGIKSLKKQYMILTRSSSIKIASGNPPWSLRQPFSLRAQLQAYQGPKNSCFRFFETTVFQSPSVYDP